MHVSYIGNIDLTECDDKVGLLRVRVSSTFTVSTLPNGTTGYLSIYISGYEQSGSIPSNKIMIFSYSSSSASKLTLNNKYIYI